jgi:hypothetical protein
MPSPLVVTCAEQNVPLNLRIADSPSHYLVLGFALLQEANISARVSTCDLVRIGGYHNACKGRATIHGALQVCFEGNCSEKTRHAVLRGGRDGGMAT